MYVSILYVYYIRKHEKFHMKSLKIYNLQENKKNVPNKSIFRYKSKFSLRYQNIIFPFCQLNLYSLHFPESVAPELLKCVLHDSIIF